MSRLACPFVTDKREEYSLTESQYCLHFLVVQIMLRETGHEFREWSLNFRKGDS
jgi:hypothetical protein